MPPLADDELDDAQREVLEPLIAFRGTALNIFRTLAHHPKLMKKWLVFGTQILMRNTLPPRERELLVLRTAWNCQAEYEYGHHVEIGMESGVTTDEVARIAAGPDDPAWSERDRLLLRAADELHTDQCISETTWTGLEAELTDEQVLDLIFLVGQYHLVSMALNSLGVPREDGVPGFEG
jgi:alkylhydroperoxidase family enzyme